MREPVERIVCLTEEPTEILHLLGEGQRVVGISAWTCRPPEAREQAPVVSAFVSGSVDKIHALEPDLVIGFSDVQADYAAELIRAGLQVLIFNQRSLDEILAVIRTIGRLVGRASEADALAQKYATRLAGIRARTSAWPRRPRVYFEEWPDPMLTTIRWVSELIDVAGGENVFATRSLGGKAEERVVSAEEVCRAAPDVILASWCGKPVVWEDVRTRPGFDALPAVRDENLHEIPSETILQPGPGALTDGLDQLIAVLEPVAHANRHSG